MKSSLTSRHRNINAEQTLELLNQITMEDLRQLAEFASRRFGSIPQSVFSAEDAVQKALLSILVGTTDQVSGRRPNPEHLHTKTEFMHYVRSVINSVVEGFGRHREVLYMHESIHEMADSEGRQNPVVLTSAPQPDADPGMIDLKKELFERLHMTAPRELLPVISEWERTFFWASRVPCRRKRDYVRQVRMLAKVILKNLAEDLQD
jgi:hypothetical protein